MAVPVDITSNLAPVPEFEKLPYAPEKGIILLNVSCPESVSVTVLDKDETCAMELEYLVICEISSLLATINVVASGINVLLVSSKCIMPLLVFLDLKSPTTSSFFSGITVVLLNGPIPTFPC